jgi:alpha-galactosidase
LKAAGAASKLRKEHPDWILTRDGQPIANGRHLDVGNPAVAKWMESEIARIIRKYDLDVFRIDYNMSTEEDGNQLRDGFVENSSWRHVENLYAMFDRLRQQFPGVIFQNCAGGGGRLDWGILRRFDNTELSDWMREPRGVKILNGMTWVLPPEILLRTFGTEVPDLSRRWRHRLAVATGADVVADLSRRRSVARGIQSHPARQDSRRSRSLQTRIETDFPRQRRLSSHAANSVL